MKEAIETTYQNLFDIKGRTTRKQYWSTWIFNIFICILAAFFAEFLYNSSSFLPSCDSNYRNKKSSRCWLCRILYINTII